MEGYRYTLGISNQCRSNDGLDQGSDSSGCGEIKDHSMCKHHSSTEGR